mmetsp:Transcript_145005/g.377277  ORF Transcript_145005/g.377277 Transcript_145005/m.377277 type:complete len:227 (+) Transcript_145005:58-738(+)
MPDASLGRRRVSAIRNGPVRHGAEVPVPEVAHARGDQAVRSDAAVDLRGDDLQPRKPAADPADALRRRDEGQEDDAALVDAMLLGEGLDGPTGAPARAHHWVHQKHMPLAYVAGQLLPDHPPTVALAAQDLADRDASAARAEGVLHGLPGADDRHPAELRSPADAAVQRPGGGLDLLLAEGQQSEGGLDGEPAQPVCVEDEVLPGRILIPDDGVHPSRLHGGRQDV